MRGSVNLAGAWTNSSQAASERARFPSIMHAQTCNCDWGLDI